MEQTTGKANQDAYHKSWYDRHYKKLLIVPIIIFALCLTYLFFFYQQHGDIMRKDVSLSGGTTITLQGDIEREGLERQLREEIPDVGVRTITELRSGKVIALIIESSVMPEELQPALERILGYELTNENSTTEFTGSSLSNNFYRQLVIALVFSFILISIVVFIMFRTFIPSLAVIFAIFADVVMPLTLINILGVKLSAAGIAAFLMLIGYSVDTDILLTTRVLKKKEGSVNERIYGAFKTGIFMNITGLLAVLPAFFIVTGLPASFRQIFFILALGLIADILNTWLTNASILKWYTDKKRIS